MAKYDFTKDTQFIPVTMDEAFEVFTNCSQLGITRIVCGNKFDNYANASVNKSVTLPPGKYEFYCLGRCKDKWLCVELVAGASSSNAENCVGNSMHGQVVCIQKKGADEPQQVAWIAGCIKADSGINVSLFSIDGQEKLNLGEYLITKCC